MYAKQRSYLSALLASHIGGETLDDLESPLSFGLRQKEAAATFSHTPE